MQTTGGRAGRPAPLARNARLRKRTTGSRP
jgi:hypothetical protein